MRSKAFSIVVAGVLGLMVVGCTGGPTAGGPPANVIKSVGWGPLEPLYDGVVRSTSQGHFENRGNSHLNLVGSYQDKSADGNTAYVSVAFQSWKVGAGSTNPSWLQYGKIQSSPEIGTATGVSIFQMYQTIDPGSGKARAHVQGCAQFGWPVPDPCVHAYPSFDY